MPITLTLAQPWWLTDDTLDQALNAAPSTATRMLIREVDLLWLRLTGVSTGSGRFLVFDLLPQHILESAVDAIKVGAAGPPSPRLWAPPSLFEPPSVANDDQVLVPPQYGPGGSGSPTWAASTQLVFRIPDDLWVGLDPGQLSDDQVLSWSLLQICLPPRAMSPDYLTSEAGSVQRGWASVTGGVHDATPRGTRLGAHGLVLVPTDDAAGWQGPVRPVTFGGRTQLWHARLHGSGPGGDLHLRALDVAPVPELDPSFQPVLSPNQRLAVAAATSTYPSGPGAIDPPAVESRPVVLGAARASLAVSVDLTALQAGNQVGWQQVRALTPALDSTQPIESWAQTTVDGRDTGALTVGPAWLYPWGPQLLITTPFARSVTPGPAAAWLHGPQVLRVLRRTVSLGAGPAGKDFAVFTQVRLLDEHLPRVFRDPDDGTCVDDQGRSVHVRLELTDRAGQVHLVSVPMVLVRSDPTKNLSSAAFTLPLHGRLLTFRSPGAGAAPPAYPAGDVTINPGPIRADGTPTFTVTAAHIQHAALGRFAASGGDGTVDIAPYNGAGSSTVWSQLAAPAPVLVPPASGGGVSALSIAPTHLDAIRGAVRAPGTSATSAVGATTVLGIFPLAAATGLSASPTVLSVARTAVGVTVTATLQQGQISIPAADLKGAAVPGSPRLDAASLSTSTTITQAPGAGASITTSGHLESPAISLSFAGGASVGVRFGELTFATAPGHKPRLSATDQSLTFGGWLQFVQTFLDYLPADAFSNPPSATIDASGARLAYEAGIPDFAAGVFSLSNVAVETTLKIPFDLGSPTDPIGEPSVQLALARPDKPCTITIDVLGGGGWFDVDLTPRSVVIDAGLDVAAVASIDFGVASGSVSASAGMHLHLSDGEKTFGAFVHLSGGVEVLGIASMSLDVMVELDYQVSNGESVLHGEAEVELRVSVLFFSTTVGFTVTKDFSAGSVSQADSGSRQAALADRPPDGGPVKVTPPTGPPDWSAYAAAFRQPTEPSGSRHE